MSDTPRTDAIYKESSHCFQNQEMVFASFARHLERELVAAIAQRDKAVADSDHFFVLCDKAVADANHFFVLSGKYLERANDAEAQRDKEIQKRKEISEATVKLFKYLRPYLTEECQKMVDEADAAVKEF